MKSLIQSINEAEPQTMCMFLDMSFTGSYTPLFKKLKEAKIDCVCSGGSIPSVFLKNYSQDIATYEKLLNEFKQSIK
jgi:hypothetical protein